jgi:hypothetical protein
MSLLSADSIYQISGWSLWQYSCLWLLLIAGIESISGLLLLDREVMLPKNMKIERTPNEFNFIGTMIFQYLVLSFLLGLNYFVYSCGMNAGWSIFLFMVLGCFIAGGTGGSGNVGRAFSLIIWTLAALLVFHAVGFWFSLICFIPVSLMNSVAAHFQIRDQFLRNEEARLKELEEWLSSED